MQFRWLMIVLASLVVSTATEARNPRTIPEATQESRRQSTDVFYDLLVEIDEKPTGSFMLKLGVNSYAGPTDTFYDLLIDTDETPTGSFMLNLGVGTNAGLSGPSVDQKPKPQAPPRVARPQPRS